MLIDALLAFLHHLAAFSVVSILVTEWAVLRPGISATQLRLVGRLDAGYGAMAGMVLIIGGLRVAFGAKGWSFYSGDVFFWAKLVTFALIGLLSIGPTRAMARWRRIGAPSDADLQAQRHWLNTQLVLAMLLPLFAALMARGLGHH
jgi:putative membrane protein